MKAFKIISITIGALIYLGAAVLFPVPVLGSTIVAGLLWFLVWNNKDRDKDGQ